MYSQNLKRLIRVSVQQKILFPMFAIPRTKKFSENKFFAIPRVQRIARILSILLSAQQAPNLLNPLLCFQIVSPLCSPYLQVIFFLHFNYIYLYI